MEGGGDVWMHESFFCYKVSKRELKYMCIKVKVKDISGQ